MSDPREPDDNPQQTQNAAPPDEDIPPPERRKGVSPLIWLLVLLALLAGGWWFYNHNLQNRIDTRAPIAGAAIITSADEAAAQAERELDEANAAARRALAARIAGDDTGSDTGGDANVDTHTAPATTHRSTRASPKAVAKRTPAQRKAPARPAAITRDVYPVARVQPEYPVNALRSREEGSVVLRVHVDASGQPTDVSIVRRSGSRDLDRAAQAAVRKWRFNPAMKNGQPVASTAQVPIDFRLARQ